MTVTTTDRRSEKLNAHMSAIDTEQMNLLKAFEFGMEAQAEVERRIAEGIKAKLAELAKTAASTD